MSISETFSLAPRLAQDTLFVTDLPLCRVLLMNDRRYPWLILVPRRTGLVELTDLESADQALFWQESMQVCELLRQEYPRYKLNLGALGNQVPQLHVHYVMRRSDDPAWPGPVWGHSPAEAYLPEEAQNLAGYLSRRLVGGEQMRE